MVSSRRGKLKWWWVYEELATCRQYKCHREINRENANHGKHVINNIWIDSLINSTCLSPNAFFNCLFYGRRYPSLSATHCLSHTLSLSVSPVSWSHPHSDWYKTPGIHFQVIIDRNKLFWYTSLFHLEVAYNKWNSLIKSCGWGNKE